MAKLIENDVRLMRRSLIALRFGEEDAANKITKYLRVVKGLNMVLPSEQTEEQRERSLNRLLPKERWLSREYGCILLPDYYDCIFLNSKWANPYTLYVHLVTPVEELDKLGEIHWLPENKKDNWEDLAEKNHATYLKMTTVPRKSIEPVSWIEKLQGLITIVREDKGP